MGRRSRKRARRVPDADRPGGAPAHPASQAGPPRRASGARGRSRRGDPPPAPWGSFPLAELCVLLALVMGVAGFVVGGGRGAVLLACAGALGSLAGLELSVREHLAGHRSHSLVLAAGLAVAAGAAMYFAGFPQFAVLILATAIFLAAFFALRELFRRRSGGFGFR
jgi:hypothetical protein